MRTKTYFLLLCISIGLICFSLFLIGMCSLYHYGLYQKDVYCCRQMSRDLEDKLEAIGIPVVICSGWHNDTCGHLWIRIGCIQFDSVTLMPCDNKNDYGDCYAEYNDYDDYYFK